MIWIPTDVNLLTRADYEQAMDEVFTMMCIFEEITGLKLMLLPVQIVDEYKEFAVDYCHRFISQA